MSSRSNSTLPGSIPWRHAPAFGGAILAVLLAGCSSGGNSASAPPPTITAQPADVTVVVGTPGTFTVAANNYPNFQWMKGGQVIPGATSATYLTPAAAVSDEGAVFTVAVTNPHGTTVSNAAHLHVNHVEIASQPSAITASAGANASFAVTATGSGALSYQWFKAGSPIQGATGSTLTLASTGMGDQGTYTCTVTSTLNGTVTTASSVPAALAITMGAPSLTSQPVDVTVQAGQVATFAVSATNGGAYQWYANGIALPGATSPTFTTPPAIAANDGSVYTCQVSSSSGSVMSSGATLRVNYLAITSQPAGAILPAGQPSQLALGVAGSGSLSYQWSKDGAALPGQTGAALPFNGVALGDAGSYVCTVTSALNGLVTSAVSNSAHVTVVGLPAITAQPKGGTYAPGDALNLTTTAAATGSGSITYQWRKDGTAISGATVNTYAIASLAATDSGTYTCAVTNTLGPVGVVAISQPAVVVVQTSPQVLSQPADQTIYEGMPATFSIQAKGTGTLAYAWYQNGSAIPGATASSYTLPAARLSDSGAQFYCVVSNGTLPDAQSRTATLTVKAAPVSFQASRTTLTPGQGVIFTWTFPAGSTATFGAGGATPAAVTMGGSQIVYPSASASYTLTVTTNGTPAAYTIPVTVKTYTPRFLYVIDNVSSDIYRYPVNPNATLSGSASLGYWYDDGSSSGGATALIGRGTKLSAGLGKGPSHIAATADERFLFVANSTDNTLSAFSADADTGDLTALQGSPFALPAGFSAPWCIAVHPSQSRIYVGCGNGIAAMDLAGNGTLTPNAGLSVLEPGRGAGDIVIHPSGNFLYSAEPGSSVVKAYAIDPGTGALSVADQDHPVTYATGFNPRMGSGGTQINNPNALTFDRSGTLLFTRSTDPLMGAQNAAIEIYAVNPFNGTLSRQSVNQNAKGDDFGHPLVDGYVDNTHGLTYPALPGVDHLFDGFQTEIYGGIWADWNVDTNTASPTYGTLLGYVNDKYWGAATERWIAGAVSVAVLGGQGLIWDRSGRVAALLCAQGDNFLIAYASDADGNIAYMGANSISGETSRTTGDTPIHGLFTGTLQ